MMSQTWTRAAAGEHRRRGPRPRPAPSDVSAQRDQLIKKGLLFAPDRGTIDFTLPGMVEFIERRPE